MPSALYARGTVCTSLDDRLGDWATKCIFDLVPCEVAEDLSIRWCDEGKFGRYRTGEPVTVETKRHHILCVQLTKLCGECARNSIPTQVEAETIST